MFESLIKIFELDGFMIQKKKGNHVVMTKLGVKRPLVIKSIRELTPATHIRTNMKSVGMTVERFFELIENNLIPHRNHN